MHHSLSAVDISPCPLDIGLVGNRGDGACDAWARQNMCRDVDRLTRNLSGVRLAGTACLFSHTGWDRRSATESDVRKVLISEDAPQEDPSRGIPSEQAFESRLDYLFGEMQQLGQPAAMLQVPSSFAPSNLPASASGLVQQTLPGRKFLAPNAGGLLE